MIRFVFDIGNTRSKCAVYSHGECVEIIGFANSGIRITGKLIHKYGIPDSAIISSVKKGRPPLFSALKKYGIPRVLLLDSKTRVPVKMRYKTPATLGADRLSNVCAARLMYAGKPVLIIDTGTCIKYDLVNEKGEYFGGSISPGLKMRYSALHKFTERLPEVHSVVKFPDLVGQSTAGSIRSGVENGMLAEIECIISRYRKIHKALKIILTGGDYQRFEDKLKSPIFVAPNLTLTGLKVILDYNEPKNR